MLSIPDFDRKKEIWRDYWSRESGKPLVIARPRTAPAPARVSGDTPYRNACAGDYASELAHTDETLAHTEFLGATMPYFSIDHGPDQFAAWVSGGMLKFAEGAHDTNWIDPVIETWGAFSPRLMTESPLWKSIIAYAKAMREHSRGRYLVGMCDLHSNADTLLALRSGEKLCMDFYDDPEGVMHAMSAVRRLYAPIYEAIYNAAGMKETGTIGWLPFYCEGRFATIQCDFVCMVSPEVSRKYIIPAIEEEADYLDHCAYHLDGPGMIPHLDDILSIKEIDAIQWVPGAGQPEAHEWVDLLKKITAAGKGVIIQSHGIANLDVVKDLHRALGGKGVVYEPWGATRDEACRIIDWLEKNS